ncbi:MAG: pH regulation protein F [Chloroflexi bacterium]|nr:pH regulation protein F [Chloroflexota bacterium]
MTTILTSILSIALVLHMLMIAVALWRVWRGNNVIDRLIGVDLVTTLTLAVLVVIALILDNSIYMDVALALAALGFVATVVLAKYVADEQMF